MHIVLLNLEQHRYCLSWTLELITLQIAAVSFHENLGYKVSVENYVSWCEHFMKKAIYYNVTLRSVGATILAVEKQKYYII